MSIQSPAALEPLVKRIISQGLSEQELKEVAVLKPGTTYVDLNKAWGTPIPDEEEGPGSGYDATVSKFVKRLFKADIIEESLVPNNS